MEIRELISNINNYDVKIIFDDLNERREKVLQGQSPLYFTPVEGKERKKYQNINQKSSFISKTAAIHILDISIDNLMELFECDGTGIYDYTKELIKPFCSEEIPESIVCVIFIFLHEVGHWMQFLNTDRNVEKYLSMDKELEKNNFDKVNELAKKRNDRIKQGSSCILTTKEKELFKQYMKEYRMIPKEKDADEFALNNIENVLKTYREIYIKK